MAGLLIYDGMLPQRTRSTALNCGFNRKMGDVAWGGYVFYEMGDGMYKCSKSIFEATGVKYITAQVTYQRTRAKCLDFLQQHGLFFGAQQDEN